ncbi:Cytochrome b5 [Hibiscus syriacus]|uniref:Cytochrome b5 n=1 Tax=Hibiscus syriacus TaxID=106335 RepID=A0A6A3BG88_HIBSY|nr:Cytochrome b5 [Hibiscus syriacus]
MDEDPPKEQFIWAGANTGSTIGSQMKPIFKDLAKLIGRERTLNTVDSLPPVNLQYWPITNHQLEVTNLTALHVHIFIHQVYTLSQVAQHKSKKDCWLVIDGRVHNVTELQEEHPGGEEALIEWAGKDATQAFNDIGHSKLAHKLLLKYRVGIIQGYTTKNDADVQPCRVLPTTPGWWFLPRLPIPHCILLNGLIQPVSPGVSR